ncbi:MAG TPA: hypothetical protein VNN77_01815 [candidate division Zixibacteria bacterium]|nr:hypothetical protein [candidate division Zixibacteria bacterium]
MKAALSAGQAGGSPGLETAPYAPISGEATTYRTSLFRALGLTLALLIAAHILLLFVYDASPLYLRVASMLIPVPFGFALAARHPGRFGLSAACGFTMAALAVWLMLVTTGYLDNVPVLPQSVRDVREVVEYAASIGLAFVTGLLLGKLRHRRLRAGAEPDRLAVLLAELFTTDRDGELGVLRLAGRIQKFVSTVTPVGTGLASLYAGIKALIGDLG